MKLSGLAEFNPAGLENHRNYWEAARKKGRGGEKNNFKESKN